MRLDLRSHPVHVPQPDTLLHFGTAYGELIIAESQCDLATNMMSASYEKGTRCAACFVCVSLVVPAQTFLRGPDCPRAGFVRLKCLRILFNTRNGPLCHQKMSSHYMRGRRLHCKGGNPFLRGPANLRLTQHGIVWL